MPELLNPYEAGRNIYGRWGRVFRNGAWMANVTEISGSVEIDKMEVRRSGTRWVDYKEGEFTGSGSLTMDYVNSDYTREMVAYINGVDPDTGQPLPNYQLPVYTLSITLEDANIPGIVFDANGEATDGHEEVVLSRVKFWDLPLGFSGDMVGRELNFTFSGVSIPKSIVDPPTP